MAVPASPPFHDDDAPVGYEEAARFLGLSQKEVQERVVSGKLPAIKYSRRATRFLVADLRAYREAHRQPGEARP